MLFDSLDHLRLGERAAVRHAEGAVIGMAPGTARDLGRFRRRQAPHLAAVELHVGGQRHMPEIEVQPHADGIGGDKEIDIAILVQLDLRVAGPRAESPHHDGGAATLAAHQFGDLVDLGNAEGDDGTAARQARQLLRSGKAQRRQAPAALEPGLGKHPAKKRAGRLGAKKHRLVDAARMQDPVGEDMPALPVAGKLDLVDGDEIEALSQPVIRLHRAAKRHRFDGAAQIAGARRDDPLLARDQPHLRCPQPCHKPVVILACQKAQRKPDHARPVACHPLQRQMRLAGVGRPEDDRHAPVVARRGRRAGQAAVLGGERHDRVLGLLSRGCGLKPASG